MSRVQHDTFIGQVQDRARLDSRGSAEEATRATLETLSERIPPDLADNLAAQLPREIAENVRRITVAREGREAEDFDRSEFVARVAQRTYSNADAAVDRARAVFAELDEATTGDTVERIRQALPEDMRDLTHQA